MNSSYRYEDEGQLTVVQLSTGGASVNHNSSINPYDRQLTFPESGTRFFVGGLPQDYRVSVMLYILHKSEPDMNVQDYNTYSNRAYTYRTYSPVSWIPAGTWHFFPNFSIKGRACSLIILMHYLNIRHCFYSNASLKTSQQSKPVWTYLFGISGVLLLSILGFGFVTQGEWGAAVLKVDGSRKS